ncbi:MAG: alpha-amylase family protein [Planctomycetota bacterium]|jgi:hypothetical protein
MAQQRKSPLDLVYQRLQSLAARSRTRSYRVPALWNCWEYEEAQCSARGELLVNPHRFLVSCFERVILPARGRRRLAGRSLSQLRRLQTTAAGKVVDRRVRRRPGDWIRRAILYAMLARATTAWDHDGDGRLGTRRWTETGTFLKSILLLPLLRRMGVEVIYLLPVSKTSGKFRKGEIGCPYSAKNFFEIEPDLHDRLLGPDPADVETEFAAFIEAAHALDMRVMVDLAPRTASRDSDLILDHPDWFYWIDVRSARRFGPPHVDGFGQGMPRPSQLGGILQRTVMRRHLACFRHAPNVTDPRRWERWAAKWRTQPPRDLLRAIGREFGVITPPGFSDVVNDSQPPWTDVTFLRFFQDHPIASVKHLADPAAQPPYVFADTIKASMFPGRRPNRPLWRLLADILPFYQRFGIDGARVDMGHALPPQLQEMIVTKPRREDPDFCFLAEEFNHAAAPAARRAGYNAIIGSCWYAEPRASARAAPGGDQGPLHRLVHDALPRSALPALAAAETPDTPRAAVRQGGRAFARMCAVLNNFLPTAVPLINSGQEVFERQPMNLGLDICPPGRFALPRSDPWCGKLAYFDRVALHWANAGGRAMVGLLRRAAQVRRRFLETLCDPGNYFAPRVTTNPQWILAIGWQVEASGAVLLVLANLDFRSRRRCVIDRLPTRRGHRSSCQTLLELHASIPAPGIESRKLRLRLEPGDVKVLLL